MIKETPFHFQFLISKSRHMESIIPPNFFFSKGEFLTARSTLCLMHFIPNRVYTKELLERMKQGSSKRDSTGTSLKKIILAHPEGFLNFSIAFKDFLNIFSIFSEDKQ